MHFRKARLAVSLALLGFFAPVAQGADPLARYLGTHQLGVNRVSFQRRSGRVVIARNSDVLTIEGEARKEPYYLKLAGKVRRIDERELVIDGDLWGIPDMTWANEPRRERTTTGTFTFRVTKGRKFWRLYEVDGKPCVCDEGCGNDFCYIDIDLRAEPASTKR